MDDTISRQAAIEAVRELYIQSPKISNDIVYDMAIDQAHDALVNLPSAQPEPCEDAVSREAVLDALRTCYDTETITYDNGDEYIHYGDAVGEVEQLPPVTPKQRTGKWLDANICGELPVIVCDQCNTFYPLSFGEFHNFCPNCGVKMKGKTQEPQKTCDNCEYADRQAYDYPCKHCDNLSKWKMKGGAE